MHESYQTEKFQLFSIKQSDPFSYEVLLLITKGSYSKQHIGIQYKTTKQHDNRYWKINLNDHVSKFYYSLFHNELYQFLDEIEEKIILVKELSTSFPVILTFHLVEPPFNPKEWNLIEFTIEGSTRPFRANIGLFYNRWKMNSLEAYVKESDDWRSFISFPSLLFYDALLDQLSDLVANFPSLRIRLLGTPPSKDFSGELYEEFKQKRMKLHELSR
jgi:hypothetical protein